MIKEQFGEFGVKVKGITIHNTGNDWSARRCLAWLNFTKSSAGAHYFVDDKEIIQVMPLSWHVWHTGKARDFGNMHTIAIEICSMRTIKDYYKAQERAFSLIKDLLEKYDLTFDDVYFHNDFDPKKYCPNRILDIYKTKTNFRKEYESWLSR